MKPLHERYVDLVASGPPGLFSRGDLQRLDEHVADGIAGTELLGELGVTSLVDAGSGGGVPGLQVAIELDAATVHLLESQAWKAQFLHACARTLDLDSRVKVHAVRAEIAPTQLGRELLDAGTARALAAPLVVAEYLSPLVRVGGHLLLWSTDQQASSPEVAANELLGLGEPGIVPAATSLRRDGVRILWPKVAPCAARIPRRIGVASRRPLR